MDQIGHRKRLKKKFGNCPKALHDYELLELLLFFVFTQKDTKSIAKQLLCKFKSLRKIIFAEETALDEIPSIGASTYLLFSVIRELFSRTSLERVQERSSMDSIAQIIDYYKLILADDIREQLRVMFLDSHKKIIVEKAVQVGTVDRAPIYPREIIKMALDYGASSIVIVHNHPSGDPTPSVADISTTKKMKKICNELDIELWDHIIIGLNSAYTFFNKKMRRKL